MPTVRDIRAGAGETPITMLTAYDAPTARAVEAAEIDMILVGDSVGNTVLGYDSTIPVTVTDILRHTAAVVRATDETLIVADMPFLSYGVDEAESIRNAGRMLKEAGADAVKLESGPHTVELTDRLTDLGIPVMAHLGLTPQHVNQLGGFVRQGTSNEAAGRILDLAEEHEAAGAFATVLEHVPANVARDVTEAIGIPTIGIGAGPHCDGQVLVIDDVVGTAERSPPFSKQFGDVKSEISRAVREFKSAVEAGEFPGEEHSHVEEGLDELY